MTKRISKELEALVVEAYIKDLVPAAKIADKIGYNSRSIYRILHRNGVDIKQSAFVDTVCHACGKHVKRMRCRARKPGKAFCGHECYYAWLAAGGDLQEPGNIAIRSNMGMRIARLVVSKHFELKPGHVVHHEDRNNTNNQLWNLRVFASNSDHIKYHRGLPVKPIWDGSI